MLDPTRLRDRMDLKGLSQSELARRIGISQQAVHRMLTGAVQGSKHVNKIARELGTTGAFLEGETDDPAPDAPIVVTSAPAVIQVQMQVTFPPEAALARMFEALLVGVEREATRAERARRLAQLLPSALSRLQSQTVSDEPVVPEGPTEAPSKPARKRRQEQRT